jgi:outer membrane protein TolC
MKSLPPHPLVAPASALAPLALVPGVRRVGFAGIRATAAALAVLLAGCAVTEPRTQVAIDLPRAFTEAEAGTATSGTPAVADDWWREFDSPQLDALIDQALAGSADLRIAAERIVQAEQALNIANASLLPTVGAAVGQSANRGETASGASTSRRSTSLNVAVNYEIDLWGRLAAGVQAQQQQLNVSRYDADTVRLALTSSVIATASSRSSTFRSRPPRC